MNLTVLVVGPVRGPLAVAVTEYEERARRYWKLKVVEVPSGSGGGSAVTQRVLEAESARILARIDDAAHVVALTREGVRWSSPELAAHLEELAVRSCREATFVIGGAFGLAPEVFDRAQVRLSLSSMTLPHELARLALAEQLYRAGTILRGERYHKGP